MTLTNVMTNPSAEVDLSGMSLMPGSTSSTLAGCAWRDTTSYHQTSGTASSASLRVNNSSSASNGVIWQQPTLAAGTWAFAVWTQVLTGTTNAAVIVRRTSDGLVLFQKNYSSPNTSYNRSTSTPGVATTPGLGFFSVSTSTQVDVIVGVGIYGSASGGSARFDECILASVGAAGIDTSTMLVPDYFDGSSPDTSATTYAWTGTANASTSTSTPVGGGTYQSWNLVYADDFSSGSVPNATHWYVQDGYKGTAGNGNRVGSLSVVSGGALHLRTNGNNISGINSKDPITYGRWIVWATKDSRPGYSPAIFGWPNADRNWFEGEVDVWEGQSNNKVNSNIHQATTGHPEISIGHDTLGIDTTKQHKYEIQWLPNSVKYLIDDVVVWTITDAKYIPTTPFKLVLQIEVKIPGGTGTASGTVRTNYPAAYSPPWELTVDRIEIYSASTSVDHNVKGEAIEQLPQVGPGTPGIPIDTAMGGVSHFGMAIESGGADLDTAIGSVPGQGSTTPPPPTTVSTSPCPRWLWTSPTGRQIELTNFVDDVEVLRGLTGWMSPPVVVKRDVIPLQPGALTRNITHGVRQVKLPLVATRADLPALESTLGALAKAMDATKGKGVLTRISVDGRSSELYCEVVSGLTGDPRGVNGVLNETLAPVFEAPDPYWHSQTITKGFTGAVAGSWFPMLGTFHLASSSIFDSFTIDATTDEDTWPVWTVVGPGQNPVLTNVDTGEEIALSASLAAGERVVIDTRPGQKTVVGPDGANWFPYLTAYDLWPLRPGMTNVSLSMTGSTSNSYLSIAYQNLTLLP